jgi:alkaline phosphatase
VIRLSRRAAIAHGTLVLSATKLDLQSLIAADGSPPLRVGLVTDLHHADKPPAGTRHYRQTLTKLEEAAGQFARDEPDLIVELGDLIDAADSVDQEKRYLETVNREFSAICPERHYVLGNHCVFSLNKDEFLDGVGQPRSFYSFDRGGYHFVVLDSCFRSDGQPYGRKNFHWTDANVPPEELDWLASDLGANVKPVVVFAHQRLDVSGNHGVNNNAAVRRILESAGNVRAVFQGHSHGNDYQEIGGIHYCTLVAMVEGAGAANNGYSVLSLEADGTLRLTGFRKQQNRHWDGAG